MSVIFIFQIKINYDIFLHLNYLTRKDVEQNLKLIYIEICKVKKVHKIGNSTHLKFHRLFYMPYFQAFWR